MSAPKKYSLLMAGLGLFGLSSLTRANAQVVSGYSGNAYNAFINVPNPSTNATFGDTGNLPSGGGTLSQGPASISIFGLLSGSLATASTTGSGNGASSNTSVSNLDAFTGVLTADLVTDSTAVDLNLANVFSSSFTNLKLGGSVISPTSAYNQVFTIPGATLTVNEVTTDTATVAGKQITGNALDLLITSGPLSGSQLIIGHVDSDITITGGGGGGSVPEAGSVQLMAMGTMGLGALGLRRRIRRKQS